MLRPVLTACPLPCPLVLHVSPRPTYTFKIPEVHFPLVSQCVQAYYCDCVARLSKAMSCLAPDNSVMLARYFYLRGLVHLMQGQLLDALLDFQSLYKTDLQIFPADLVRRAVQSMAGPMRAQAESRPELRRLISEVLEQPGEAPKADDRVKHFELPSKHMQLDEFVRRVQESGIVRDVNIISRLFEALTVGERTSRPMGGGWSCLPGRVPNGKCRPGRPLPGAPGVGRVLGSVMGTDVRAPRPERCDSALTAPVWHVRRPLCPCPSRATVPARASFFTTFLCVFYKQTHLQTVHRVAGV